ncbi:MAG: MFS transporter [Acidobacteriales bacterium]|nr:MFS transporter [Terriglobales bacterium]
MNDQTAIARARQVPIVNAQGLPNSRRWSIVTLLFVASLINYTDRASMSVALPYLAQDLGLNPVVKGLVLSAFFWSYALMQIPIGWCVDRLNLRWLYAGSFVLWSVACGMIGLVRGLYSLLLLRVLLGIGESIFLPGGMAVVSRIFRARERGLPTGLFESGSRLGLALGTPLLAWLIMRYGWRNMFFLMGFSALLWLIPWFAVLPNHLRNNQADQDPPARAPSEPRTVTVTLDRNLVGICLTAFCYNYYWLLLVTWLPDFLVTARHLTLLKAGVYALLPYFVFGATSPIGGWIADRLIRLGWDETRTRKGIITVAFICGLLLVPAAWVTGTPAALSLVVGASLVGTATANLLVIIQSCAPAERVGVWTGVENFVGNLAGVVAPIVTGILIAWTGSYLPGFALAAGVLLAGLFAVWLIIGELRPPVEEEESETCAEVHRCGAA